MIAIFHAQSRKSRFQSDRNIARACWLRGEFRLVAIVETASLERAYELTNTISRHWPENVGVKLVAPIELSRSTSVGDIAMNESGSFFLCENPGWSNIDLTCDLINPQTIRS